MLYMDLPYGLGHADWDEEVLSPEDISLVLRGFINVNTSNFYAVMMWCHPKQVGDIIAAMKLQNFSCVQTIYWHKVDSTAAVPPHLFVQTVETGVIGYHTTHNQFSTVMNMPMTLLDRHNIIIGPGQRSYDRSTKGKVINICQKPPYLSEKIASMFCLPGSKVLVLGSGSGGDVKGLMNCHLDVIAVEQQQEQVSAMMGKLRTYKPKSDLALITSNADIRLSKQVAKGEHEEEHDELCSDCKELGETSADGHQLCKHCALVFCLRHWPLGPEENPKCPTCVALENQTGKAESVVIQV
jgi:hypothetical protein